MKFQIVSYKSNLPWQLQDELNCRLFNQSSADLILFPGWAFQDTNHIENFKISITNKKTFGIMELQRLDSRKITNCLYSIQGGQIEYASLQYFSTSDDINENPVLGEMFLKEFATNKCFQVKRKKVRVIQCGELNILKNEQANNNRVKFRFNDDRIMNAKFHSLLIGSDIILNPQHTEMGNQGKLSRRREYLSAQGRIYISTTNAAKGAKNFNNKALHYIYYNGRSVSTDVVEQSKHHTLWECAI